MELDLKVASGAASTNGCVAFFSRECSSRTF